jgi:acetyltransferase
MTKSVAAKKPGATLRGVTIEPMRTSRGGREILVGLVRDATFGPALVVGAGGVLVELIGDRSVELPPLNAELAQGMVERTRARKLLGAYRGMAPADRAALERVLLAVSDLACELPELRELDINPVLVDEHGAVAVDARIVLDLQPREAAAAGASRYAHMAIEPYPRELARTLQLPDGAMLRIRPIRPEDATSEQSFVRALSTESRYFRFHQGLSSLTTSMLVRFTQIDYDREMALLALVNDGGTEKQIAVARYATEANERDADFAIVVSDAWHKRGVGTALMRALIERARDKGLEHLHGDVLAENGNMLTLMHELGFRIERHPEDAMLQRVTLDLRALR